MDAERSFRRLVKKVAGVVTKLWEDATRYAINQTYRIDIVAIGDRLIGWLNDELLFSIRDGELQQGRAGFYCWANQAAFFHDLTVERAVAPYVLWEPSFTHMNDLDVVVESGAQTCLCNGAPRQAYSYNPLACSTPDSTAFMPGTFAVGGSVDWSDVEISAEAGFPSRSRTRSASCSAYNDRDNYYRFSMSATTPYRRLIKRIGGVVSVLWRAVSASRTATSADTTGARAASHRLPEWPAVVRCL